MSRAGTCPYEAGNRYFAVLAVIRRRILTDQARQAGKARKSDALQRLIEQMVERYFADAPGVVQEVFGGEGSQHLRLPVLNGPIEVRDTKAVDEEINDFKAALGNTSPDTALSRPSRLS